VRLQVVRFIAVSIAIVFSTSAAHAMDFTWNAGTVRASGIIQRSDVAKFAALPPFTTLELDSPGGDVDAALAIAANMDARGGIRTAVKPGVECASACAAVLFVSGATRVVYWGGKLGIHSCANGRGTPIPDCNADMASNALSHGVPWGDIESVANTTAPTNMLWFSAEDAECWGFMQWSVDDESHFGIACFKAGLARNGKSKPNEVTAQNANDILCRMNAGTSRIYVPSGAKRQGFSDAYRKACERVAADPRTPPYAAVDILMWLMLTDPNILSIKPATLMLRIMGDNLNFSNCWKCMTIAGMSYLMHGYPKDALEGFQRAVALVKRDTGDVPKWLVTRVNLAATETAKQPAAAR
jgi:hypothetical protein